jgi:DNA-directed RNA polymerase subunit omega
MTPATLAPAKSYAPYPVSINEFRRFRRDGFVTIPGLVPPEDIADPNILINVVSRRVKQLRRGSWPLVKSLEKLSPEDTALREIAEGKITYELATPEDLARGC